MRNVMHILTLFGCVAVVRAEDGASTNTDRPKSIEAARVSERRIVIKHSEARSELNSGSNLVRLGTNAVTLAASPDIKANQTGQYYKAFVGAVERRWTTLLEQRDFVPNEAGTVVLEFKLHQNGQLTDMKVVGSTVDEVLCLICQKSVLDPCPFARWPNEMQQGIGAEHCTLTLTFKYPPGAIKP
jgi:hypothetical protein